MKDKTKSILTGAATIGAVAAASSITAHADIVNHQQPTTAPNNQQNQQLKSSTVSKINVNHTKTIQDQNKIVAIKAQQTSQQTLVNQANTKVQQDQTKLDQQKTQMDQTQQQINQQAQTVDQTKQQVETLQSQAQSQNLTTAQQTAQNNMQQANDAVKSQQQTVIKSSVAVKNAQTTADQANQTVQHDQQQVAQTQTNINQTKQQMANLQQKQQQTNAQQAKVDNAQQNVNQAQKHVDQAQTKLQQDQQKQTTDQQNHQHAPEVQQAQQHVTQAQQELTDATQSLQNAQNKLNADQHTNQNNSSQLGTPWLSNDPKNNGEQNGNQWNAGVVGKATLEQEQTWDNGVHVDQNAQQILDQLNLQRIAHGVAPVQLDPYLQQTAQWRVADDNSNSIIKNFNHTDEGSNTAFQHGYCAAAENIAEGFTPDQCVNGWNSEPTHSFDHRMNDFDPSYTNVGIAFNKGYAVIDFAGKSFVGGYNGLDDNQIWTGDNSVKPISMLTNVNNQSQLIQQDQAALNVALTRRKEAQATLLNAQNALQTAIQNNQNDPTLTNDANTIKQDQTELQQAEQALTTAQTLLQKAQKELDPQSYADQMMTVQKQYQDQLDTLKQQQHQLQQDQAKQTQANDQLATLKQQLQNDQTKLQQLQQVAKTANQAYQQAMQSHHAPVQTAGQLAIVQQNLQTAQTKLNNLQAQFDQQQKNYHLTLMQLNTDRNNATLAQKQLDQINQKLAAAMQQKAHDDETAQRQDANQQHVDLNNNPLPANAKIDSAGNIVKPNGDVIGHQGKLNNSQQPTKSEIVKQQSHVNVGSGIHQTTIKLPKMHQTTVKPVDQTASSNASKATNNVANKPQVAKPTVHVKQTATTSKPHDDAQHQQPTKIVKHVIYKPVATTKQPTVAHHTTTKSSLSTKIDKILAHQNVVIKSTSTTKSTNTTTSKVVSNNNIVKDQPVKTNQQSTTIVKPTVDQTTNNDQTDSTPVATKPQVIKGETPVVHLNLNTENQTNVTSNNHVDVNHDSQSVVKDVKTDTTQPVAKSVVSHKTTTVDQPTTTAQVAHNHEQVRDNHATNNHQTATQQSTSASSNANTMPQTGDNAAKETIFGTILATLGFNIVDRKRRHN